VQPILSINDLARRLGTPVDRPRQIADEVNTHYRFFSKIDAKKQKTRHFRDPSAELKEIQRRLKRLLERTELSAVAHGGVRGRSPRSNASQHLEKPCVVTVDVRQFFPNVRHYIIYRLFRRELKHGRDVARLMTRLVTLHAQLPQGAPTSTVVANLLLTSAVDAPILAAATSANSAATRFVDDIAFSGADPRSLINDTAQALSRKRLPIWRKKAKFQSKSKLHIAPNSRRQEATGLVVNGTHGPSISRQRRDAVRAAIFQLKDIADTAARAKAVRSLRGRIAYVRQFNPGSAVRLQQYLEIQSAAMIAQS
jgi:RNA-directed DNA polymerase